MRRLLVPVALLFLGGVAVAVARRVVASRPPGTPSSWPAVPRRAAAGPA